MFSLRSNPPRTFRKSDLPAAFSVPSRPLEVGGLTRGIADRASAAVRAPSARRPAPEFEPHDASAPSADAGGQAPRTTAIVPRPGSDAEHYNREITARTAAGSPVADLHLLEALEAVLLHDASFADSAAAAMESLGRADVDRMLREFEVRKLFTSYLFTYLVEDLAVPHTAQNGALVAAAAKAEIERAAGRPAAAVPGMARLVSPKDFAYAVDRTKSELPFELAGLVRANPYLLLRFDAGRADMVARAALGKLRALRALGVGPSAVAAAASRRAMDALTPTVSARKDADPEAGTLAALRYAALRYAAQKAAKPRPASAQLARAA